MIYLSKHLQESSSSIYAQVIVGRKVRGQKNEIHRNLPRVKVDQIYQIFVRIKMQLKLSHGPLTGIIKTQSHGVFSVETIEFETPTLNEKGEIIARTRHAAEQFTEELGNGINLELIVIPAGIFQMGSPRNTGSPDEQPQHFVTIKSFMMGKFLVTQVEWKTVMGKLPPCRFKGDNLPVERVSWEDAQKFCLRLSNQTGRNYQLPTETQWEYACRAGTTSPFSFGETLTA